MAGVAGLREVRRDVVRIGRVVEVRQVAGHAGGAGQAVVIADVAVGAQPRRDRVQTGQSEARGRVVERAVGPQHRVVAVLARGREACRCVRHRGRRIVVVGLMARDAGRICNRVIVVDVTIGANARRHGVIAGQGEARAVVIEGRIQPRRGGVACVAGLREVRRDVVRIGRVVKSVRWQVTQAVLVRL